AKLANPDWAPDFGPAEYNHKVIATGATAIGARPFLIAFNVNLNTKSTRKAMKIAATIREMGMYCKDEKGRFIVNEKGEKYREPGMFKCVKAIGWYIEEYGCCQVSINFTDYRVSSVHDVVDATRRVADREGVIVTGCELVGLIPLDAMLQAGWHYLRRQEVNPGVPEKEVVEVAIRSLGLRDLGPFDANEAIIEHRIDSDGPLVSKTGREFIDALSSDAPAPGGGSVAALCGAMSTGLAAMVGQLTTGKKGYQKLDDEMNAMAVKAQTLKERFLADIDEDTAAFDAIMTAFGLPKKSAAEKKARHDAIQSATRHAIEIPLGVLERTVETVGLVKVAIRGNENARSDAGVAALTAEACAEGAWYNVCINLQDFEDQAASADFRARADTALATVTEQVAEIRALVRSQLG
ncbi:MAG: glutamate formimidoyltransferase, partial [Proteobacteria bacterium]|nr:glutamate formimidoyltransferase [Pseudomonadota bacterium]